ncbi:MAG: hypothetical protein UZ09_BCD002001692 [Bacteroidetes bacterium OLB9]|nr:MAG: hypothetical protein UZ09_BCD002001692 [Bacteroidetes bacterium OLB9]
MLMFIAINFNIIIRVCNVNILDLCNVLVIEYLIVKILEQDEFFKTFAIDGSYINEH